MNRWKAAGIHLALSAVIVTAVALGLILVWYGWDLFVSMGAARQLMILAAVDVVIGPLLTLIVFKLGKPSLKFDLTVIALLQVAFLIYGMHIMWQSRPVFLVAVLDRFELVFANEIDDEDVARAPAPFAVKSGTGPVTVGGKLAQNSQETYDLAMAGSSGRDIQHMPERYLPYTDVAAKIAGRAQPLKVLSDSSPAAAEMLQKRLRKLDRTEESVTYVPIISRRGRATMLLDAKTGEVLGPLAIDPWFDL